MSDDLALFGTVRSKAEQIAWMSAVLDDAVASEVMTQEEADEHKKSLEEGGVNAIPMTLARDSQAGTRPLLPEHAIPESWDGKFIEHRVTFDKPVNKLTFTHVVLLEGPPKETQFPFYFGGKAISAPFVIILFDETTNEYKYLHCADCAMHIVKWLGDLQAKWKRATEPSEFDKATHDAPQKLQ